MIVIKLLILILGASSQNVIILLIIIIIIIIVILILNLGANSQKIKIINYYFLASCSELVVLFLEVLSVYIEGKLSVFTEIYTCY